MRIGAIKIPIVYCDEGIYLRWYYNGWHYWLFTSGYEIQLSTQSMGTQVTRFFSVISKIERPTRLKAEYSYRIILEGITAPNIGGFSGLLMAEKIMQFESGVWREVELTRGDHVIKDENGPGYILDFEITRKELPIASSVYQKVLKLYLDSVLCDLDEDEVVPVNKQTNDIAEMQDRQSDFTAQFRIKKTREMKDLFELSGEAGINTNFPYEEKSCRLVQDNIEVITNGRLVLDKVDDEYYYVSILSGNINFFKEIEGSKLPDLTLASTNHTWDVATMAASHASDLDYVYPLLEPSDDGGIDPLTDDGDRVEMYGGWIWPFVKVKAIWDEIFSNVGYYCSGDILTNEIFTKLFMPVSSRSVTKAHADKFLYSVVWNGSYDAPLNATLGFTGAVLINGDENFRLGFYYLPFDATYKIFVTISFQLFTNPVLAVYKNGAYQGDMTVHSTGLAFRNFEYEFTGTVGQHVEVLTSAYHYGYYNVRIVEIETPIINYGSSVVSHYHLPELSQVDFVKLICNMFGLIPEVTPRDKKIYFWNYSELYENIAIARDWSAYLSERDDEVEFKFGEYAQNNFLRYKESEDVIKDNGTGTMIVDDYTLPVKKDALELPVSTCDEVTILPYELPIAPHVFQVNVSRIAFNKFNADSSLYEQNKTIDPRIVYVASTNTASTTPVYQKTLGLRATYAPGAATDIDSPKKASSLEVSFSNLVYNYSSLSRLLTKTNLRRAKFNLPVYEVAGLKHYIPIYLSQYKAYFYVNKINNYVPGQLCTIDLIKL